MLDLAGYSRDLFGKKVLEYSFGSGNIIKQIVKRYVEDALTQNIDVNNISSGLSADIYGIELDPQLYDQCISDLNEIVRSYGISTVNWSFVCTDALQWTPDIKFDFIIGNPPYYLNEWVQVHKASIQPATFISYNRMITGRITQYFEPLGLKLCEVTPQVLDEFQEKILLEGYTTNTVIHYHAIFGKAFKDAVRKDYLETNPMLKVDRPKKNSFRPNFYSKDEVQQLLEVSQDDPLHLCILITAYYGLRRSEVLGLKWSSIDFERKSITINHKVTEQLVNGKYVPVVSDVMKNKTSCRTLPLIPAVEEELLKQKEKQQLYRKLFKKSYSTEYLDFVCTDQEGKLIRPNFVTEHFDWLLTKYGLKHIRFHDLRHSCASLMVMNGVSMKQVQEWLGHSTFSTTADIYAHLDYKSKQGSAGVIANLLGESKLPK